MLHGSLPLRVAPLPRLNDVMNIYYRKSLLLQWVTPQSILNGGIVPNRAAVIRIRRNGNRNGSASKRMRIRRNG